MKLKKIQFKKKRGYEEGLFLQFDKKGYLQITPISQMLIESFGEIKSEEEISEYNIESLLKPRLEKK